jgi:hypothetical protein
LKRWEGGWWLLMSIEGLRDLVIIIFGIFSILVVLGVSAGLFIVYLKTRTLVKTVTNYVRNVRKWMAYIQGLAKGLNESLRYLKKGGI